MVSLGSVLKGIVLLPVFLIFFVLLLAFFLVYLVTLVGPIYHWVKCSIEKSNYLDRAGLLRRHPDLKTLSTTRGRLFYRWTLASSSSPASEAEHSIDLSADERSSLLSSPPPSSPQPLPASQHPKRFPVVLPGGLGSTLAATAFMHDALAAAGFDCLSFDRLGVGYSDPLDAALHRPSMQAHIDEMHALLQHLLPPHQRVILVGGSFGSTVGQLYAAQHPQRVAGFVCLDGLPHPLSLCEGSRDSFTGAVPRIYALEAALSDLGLFRFPIWLLTVVKPIEAAFRRCGITFPEVYAQLQSSALLRTIAAEAPLMMDCCDLLAPRWGALSPPRLAPQLLARLQAAPPSRTLRDGVLVEAGAAEREEIAAVREALRGVQADEGAAQLVGAWRGMPAVSMSCTNYGYDSFEMLTQEMRRCYAAEHTLLALLSQGGERWLFPDHTHLGTLTLSTEMIAAASFVSDRAFEIAAQQQGAASASNAQMVELDSNDDDLDV